MLLVLDVNILFSAIIKMSKTLDLIFNPILEICSPDFILEEFIEHKDEIAQKSGLNYSHLLMTIVLLSDKIKFISLEEYKEFLLQAVGITSDKDDTDYFALALKMNCAIWSNDKRLKEQDNIKVYLTEELVGMLE